MKSHLNAVAAGVYGASTIILLALLGSFVFRQSIVLREAVGMSRAKASIVLMSHE
jgi:multidrug transporter EmrE-like cation transporter